MPATELLIAEVDESVAQELKVKLQGLGYKVTGIIHLSDDAFQAVEELQPQLVLMNVRLRGTKSGIKTGSLIHTLHNIPIVYLVDFSNQATIQRAGVTGPFGYIFRPFDEKYLYATIETALIRHKMERKLQQSRQWLNTTLTSIGDGVIATDEQAIVRFINPVAMELTGWRHTEAIGRPLLDVFCLINEISHERMDLSGGLHKLPHKNSKGGVEGLLLSANGGAVPVEANLTSIQDGENQIYGMVLVFRDVTQQRETMQEIKRQANRAEALMQVASQLNSQLEIATVLNTICDIVNRTFMATGTVVALHLPSKGVFRAMAAISHDPVLKASQEPGFEVPQEVFQRLLSHENPVVVIKDVRDDVSPPCFELFKKAEVRTVAIAALFRGNNLIGALISAFTQEPRLLPDDEVALLRGLADQASSAIQNAELFDQVRVGRERQRKLSKTLVDIQEAERRHIAKELHDHLGQILTGLQFMLETTKQQAMGAQRSNLEEIQNVVSDVIAEVREMSLNLRPSMLDDMGLVPTLLWHFDRYTSQTGIRVNFQRKEIPDRLPLEIETAAYRIIQEALTNVARHAQVREVLVGLLVQNKALWVEVLDKGKGFRVSADLERPSSGLSGMRERASLLGGYVVVESFLNQGTQIVAALPLTDQPLERRKYDRNSSAG
jgi:PAS domain S-box-containing protein